MNLIEIDLALMRTASNFDLSTRKGRNASANNLRLLFKQLLKRLKPDVLLEIGAREASFSCGMRRFLPVTRMVAFDANPYAVEMFGSAPDIVENQIDYRHLAVSDHEGQIDFHIQSRRDDKPKEPSVGSNSILARLGDVETTAVSVPCVRIDRFIEREGLTGTMAAWIDVEGAVGSVFSGFGDRLGEFQMLFVEVEDFEIWSGQWTWPKVLEFLVGQGFHPVARDFEFDGQYNVLFLRAGLLSEVAYRRVLTTHFSATTQDYTR